MKKIYLLFIATAFLFACSDDTTTNPDKNNPKALDYPLATGNQWKYEEVFTNQEGNVTEKSGNYEIHTVGKQVQLYGKTAFEIIRMKVFAGANSEIDTSYMYNNDDGLYESDPKLLDHITAQEEDLIIEYIELASYNDDPWFKYYYPYGDTLFVKVLSASEMKVTGQYKGTKEVTIQGKNYNANIYHILHETNNLGIIQKYKYELQIVDKIGICKKTEIETSGNGSWGLVLTEFTPAK